MRRRFILAGACGALFGIRMARAQSGTGSEIAPGGRLRVALLVANPVLVRVAPDGGLGGMAPELGRFIAARLGARFEPVIYRDVQSFTASYGTDAWDILIGPHTQVTAENADFSPDVMLVDNLYVAAPGRDFAHADQVDRPGVKIAVANGGAPEQFLSRALRNATLVRIKGETEDSVAALQSGAADAYASNGENTFRVTQKLPGARILPGAVTTVRMGVAMPKGRSTATQAELAQLVGEAKEAGLIAKAIATQDLKGVRAAP